MAVTAMLAISWWAFKRMPTPTLVGHERVASGVTVTSSSSTPSADWTIHLRLDPSMKPPGQGWILHEGKQIGDGYELHWLPEKLGLQILRAPDHLLLGTSRLSRMPRTVEFVRRGPWLMVRCDAKLVLTCLDPLGAPLREEAAASGGYQAWGCTPVGSMGDTAITVEDDREQSDADIAADIPSEDDPREHDAVALVRQVLVTDPTKASARDIEAVFGAAAQALSQLPAGSAPHLRLRHWLALGEIQLALARPDDFEGAERASDAVDQLAMLCASEPVPEAAGILMSLFPRLAYNACFRPSYPDPPAHVLGNRSMWMRVLGAAAVAAHANASPAIGDDLQFQLRLLIHACGCLQTPAVKSLKTAADAARDAQPQPSPAEAPPWLSSRWRAFSGIDPEVSKFPEMPGSRSDPVAIAIERLSQGAVLEPVAAVSMRHKIARILTQIAPLLGDDGDARSREALAQAAQAAYAATEGAPPREAVLARALMAMHNLGSKERAFEGLMTKVDRGRPWIQRDPLAFALASLMLFRDPALKELVQDKLRSDDYRAGIPGATILRFPDELRPFELLLSGKSATTDDIWLHDPEVLPPAQALATALAMQEARSSGGSVRPSWALLRQVPCYTLPLDLLIPAETTPPRPSGTDSGHAPAPIVP